jgi:anti-sigma factor RsiW
LYGGERRQGVTCSSALPLIEAQVDDELDPNGQAVLREHLESCAACREAQARLLRLRGAIRGQDLYFRAPDSLRRRVLGSLRDEPARSERWKWFAVAASVALSVSLGANVFLSRANRTDDFSLLARDVVSDHVRSMLSNHMIDVVSSDRHTVKPWFGDKLDFSPDVRDLTTQGFPLAGGRVDYLDGRPVAALVFHRAKHLIDLFTWPSGAGVRDAVSQNGLNVVAWTKGGMVYWAVSDLNAGELNQFAHMYRE